ncbi:MAG: hypothetical protein ACI9Y1_001575 [Lentisphaeria bacterium]|jgi:hypothetical protein
MYDLKVFFESLAAFVAELCGLEPHKHQDLQPLYIPLEKRQQQRDFEEEYWRR